MTETTTTTAYNVYYSTDQERCGWSVSLGEQAPSATAAAQQVRERHPEAVIFWLGEDTPGHRGL